MSISVDIGSGPSPKNPFNADQVIGVDIAEFNLPHVKTVRVGFETLPFPDSSVNFVSAFDCLEHIPRYAENVPTRNPFIYLMSEIWRILAPDGLFYAQTPAYPFPTAFSDPTHVNIITPDTVRYFASEQTSDGFSLDDDRLELCQRYGFTGKFIAIRNYSVQAFGHQIWLLKAIK